MNIDQKKLTKNIPFIITSIVIVVLSVIITLIFKRIDSNTPVEKVDLEDSGEPNISSLVINEIMSSNSGSYSDEEGNLYDWIELYNGNNYDINLLNYGLSDEANRTKWVFPDATIKAKGYLIIFLCGETKDGLYANFKLSKNGGESIAIKNNNGKVVDAVETIALNGNEVMIRNLEGQWQVSEKSTPGYSNTKEGYENYQKSLVIENTGVIINEILPRNKGNFINEDNILSGYIEITNTTSSIINLKGYGLSDNANIPMKYQFPNISISPNETIIVYTSTNGLSEDNYYSGFKLNEKTGSAVLSYQGKIVDKIDYENLPNGMAYIKGKGSFFESNNISPGYLNTTDGSNKFSSKYLKNKNTLIINEVMNNNTKHLAQNGGEYYDWIEIKNNSNEIIELKEYFLNKNDTGKGWQLPDVKLAPNEIYVVMASGDTNLSNNSYKHTDFKISEVDSIYLFKNNKIIDSIFIANIPLDYSMGRSNDSGYYYFSSPTPKKENGTGTREIAYAPLFSEKGGIYNSVENIKLTLTGNGTIYYTTDGSTPSKSSKVYNGPIFLSKTTVVKAISYENNKLFSPVITNTYVINENHTIPVMSISLKQTNFNSVQSNSWNDDLEVAAYAELYENGKSFSLPCGFKLFGGTTRGLKKKSFALKFKKAYGASSLNYQVFENRNFSKFETLVLRSGSTDYERTYFRDSFMTSMLEDLNTVEVQAYKTVALYINGQYWGLYDIREKIESEFISNRYNVSKENVNITRIDYDVTCGSKTWYRDIVNFVKNNNMATQGNYEKAKEKIDVTSLIDFWVVTTYTTNNDIVNARFYSHPDIDNGKLKTIFYDQDWALYNYNKDYFNFITSATPMSRLQIETTLLRNLMKNDEFKKTFVERISYIMNNILTDEKLNKKLDEFYNYLKPEMEREQTRWGLTMKTWNESVDQLKEYISKRRKYMLAQAKDFFKLTNAQMKEYFGDDYD